MAVLGQLEDSYVSTKVCRGLGRCYNVEPELQALMKTSRDPAELLWSWQEWRDAIGPPTRLLYPTLISLQNYGASNSGTH